MNVRNILRMAMLGLTLVPSGAFAQRTLNVDLGANLSFAQLSMNLTGLLAGFIVLLCVVIFVAGAFLMVISRGQQDQLQKGKDFMIRSLMGMAVVLGSYGILRTAFFLLY